jgi:TfoX/Sxy family transcriptional regulator of competence genes
MSQAPSPEERFAALVATFASNPAVTLPQQKKAFGSSTLRVNGRIFAMLVQDKLVLKLHQARVATLIASGEGAAFDAGKGKPMKEWLRLESDVEERWRALANEALEFVGSTR